MKVAIIGAGGIAGLHRNSYIAQPGVEISAVVDPSPAARERAEKEWGTASFATPQELLANAKPDAVSVCSPPKFHGDGVIPCLEAGVPVLCEKPMARTVAEAQAMVDAAERTKTILMLAFCHRYESPLEQIKTAINDGKLGRVLMVRNRFGGRQDMTGKWFGDPDIAGGGAALDTSIHSIDIFRFLAGDVAWVDGFTAAYAPNYRVEDSCVMMLGAKSGAVGVIEGSWSTPGSANIVEVYGSEGAAVVDYNTGKSQILEKGSSDWKELTPEGPWRFEKEVIEFLSAIRENRQPAITANDGLQAVRIAQAVYQSQKEGKRITL